MKIERFEIASKDVGTVLATEALPMFEQMAIAGLSRGGLQASEWGRVSVEMRQGLIRKSYAVTIWLDKSDISATLTHTVGLLRWIGRDAVELESACYYAGRVMKGWIDSGVSATSPDAIETGAEFYRRLCNDPEFSQYLPPDVTGQR